jgi:hypothetical protein
MVPELFIGYGQPSSQNAFLELGSCITLRLQVSQMPLAIVYHAG